MPEPNKQEIEARAYKLWEQAGRPEDREAEFWQLAEQELRNEDKSSPTRTPDNAVTLAFEGAVDQMRQWRVPLHGCDAGLDGGYPRG